MQRIGRAAARLFNQKGYLETSLADISSAVGMSKGGIFHYFPTKNEILYFMLSNYMDVVLEGLEEGLKKCDDSLSKIRFIISRHLELYAKNVHEAKRLLHEANLLPFSRSGRRRRDTSKSSPPFYRTFWAMVPRRMNPLFL